MADLAELKMLQHAVQEMDCLAYDGLSQISAVARLALAFMESPAAYSSPETIWYALENILAIASQARDSIGSDAHSVGFGYSDDGYERRMKAWMAFRIEKEECHG